jgi:hypothetical protein
VAIPGQTQRKAPAQTAACAGDEDGMVHLCLRLPESPGSQHRMNSGDPLARGLSA